MLTLNSPITVSQRCKCHMLRCQDCGDAMQTDIPTVCDPELLSRNLKAYSRNGYTPDELDKCLLTTGTCVVCNDYKHRMVDIGECTDDNEYAGMIEVIGTWTTSNAQEIRSERIAEFANQFALCINWFEWSHIKQKALSEFKPDIPSEITHHIELTQQRLIKFAETNLNR